MSHHAIENPNGMLNIKTNTSFRYLGNYGCFNLGYLRLNSNEIFRQLNTFQNFAKYKSQAA